MAIDPTAVIITIGGALVTPFARVGRVRIDDLLNDTPNTAALTIVFADRVGPPSSGAFYPGAFDATAFATAIDPAPILKPPPVNVGMPIALYLGSVSTATQIFGGQIMTREQYAEFDQPKHVRFDLTCVDFTRRLNHRKVVKEYGQQSATAIVNDVIANYAPGITTAHVQAGLGTIDGGITFTFEEVSRALSRIAEKIGAYWYLDYVGDLHFFTGSEPGTPPAPLVPGGDFANFKISADLSQVRTRVIVEGDGATALITLSGGGAGVKPISQTSPFNPAGGRAKIGPNLVTYSGIQAGSAKTNTVGVGTGGTPPPTAPIAPVATPAGPGVSGGLSGGPYQYAVTVELSDGSRSALGAPSSPVTIAPASNPPPTSAALFNPPIKGPIAVGVSSTYATTFVDANGRETAATQGGTSLTGRTIDAPQTPPVLQAANLPGGIVPGNYYYVQTFLTAAGETTNGPVLLVSVLNAPSGVRILLQTRADGLNAAGDGRIIGRRVYRCSVGLTTPWHHVVDVPNNQVGITVDDTLPDAQLPTRQLPQYNSATDTGEAAIVTIPTSIDARVVRRRLYRKDGAGESRLIAEIPDNAATTYNDVTIAPGTGLAPTTNAITTGAIDVSGIPLGPAATVRRRVFRTTAGGSQFRELVSLENNTTTTVSDAQPDANLGGSPLPSQGGAGAGAPPTAIGAGEIRVASVTGFPAPGWVAVEGQIIFYTNAGNVSGGLYLYGIPGSGPGSITAQIPDGTVVTASPALVGVSPDVPLTLGDPVQLIVQVDDVPAQQAIAALEGGDGIIEHYIQDRRLSEAGALARARADLALFKTVELELSYTTRDPNTTSGKTVHVDLPAPTNVVGDFLIQRVTIDDVSFAKDFYPRRSVSASTTRFSFDDVLARILMEQA